MTTTDQSGGVPGGLDPADITILSVRELIAQLGVLEERARECTTAAVLDVVLRQQAVIVRELRRRRGRRLRH